MWSLKAGPCFHTKQESGFRSGLWSYEAPNCLGFMHQGDQLWIKLLACQLPEFLQGALQRKGLSVRTICRHGIDCIGNHNDSSTNRYVLSDETIGVARAVIILMVMLDSFEHCSA